MSSSNLLHRDALASRAYSLTSLGQYSQAEHEIKGHGAEIDERRVELRSQWAVPRNSRTVYIQEADDTLDRAGGMVYPSTDNFNNSRNVFPGYFQSVDTSFNRFQPCTQSRPQSCETDNFGKVNAWLASSSEAFIGDRRNGALSGPCSASGRSSTDYHAQHKRTLSSEYNSATSFNSADSRVSDRVGHCSFNRLVLVAGFERLRLHHRYSKIGREFTLTFQEYCINQLNSMRAEEMSSTDDNESEISSVYADTGDEYDKGRAAGDRQYWASNDCEADVSDSDFDDFDGWDF
ncbi:hypothetical protein BJ165DRAFT_1458609 [Panaeolus papilionaceus]|nr:hypothetical protein BJ165DRAFT_1458609 [Panaeolus papilionaceus]